jgi:hypothetical protein
LPSCLSTSIFEIRAIVCHPHRGKKFITVWLLPEKPYRTSAQSFRLGLAPDYKYQPSPRAKLRFPAQKLKYFHPCPETLPHRPKPRSNAIPVKAPRKQFEVRPAHTFKSDIAAFRAVDCTPERREQRGILGRIYRSNCTPFKQGLPGWHRKGFVLPRFDATSCPHNQVLTLCSKVFCHTKLEIVARIG